MGHNLAAIGIVCTVQLVLVPTAKQKSISKESSRFFLAIKGKGESRKTKNFN